MPTCVSFEAYSCNHPTVIGEYGWREDSCSNYEVITESKTSEMGTIIQVPKITKVKGRMLSINRRSESVYCSYFQLTSFTIGDLKETDYEPYKLDLQKSRVAMNMQRLELEIKTVNLTLGTELVVLDSNNLDDKGFCEPHSSHITFYIYKIRYSEVDVT